MQDKAAQVKQIEQFLAKAIQEAENAQEPWLNLAGEIYDLIDGRVSTGSETDVHVNTVGTAYERIKAELTRGLVNFDKWLNVEHSLGSLQNLMTPRSAGNLVKLGLDGGSPRTAIVDMLGSMLVENRSGIKLHPCYEKRPGQKASFHIKWVPLNLNNYFVDPGDPAKPLYEFFACYMPKYQAAKLPGVWAEALKDLRPFVGTNISTRLLNEGDIDGTRQDAMQTRHDVRILEFWGTVLDDNGNVMVWECDGKSLPLENVQILCANDGKMIADPIPNKRYSGRSPFVVAPLLRSGKSAYRPGLLVNGAEMNKHMNVLISSLLTGGIKAAHNVTVVHKQWLANPEVVENGLEPNTMLVANEDMPPGAKLFTSEKIGDIPSDSLQLYQILRQLAGENMFASDQFMTGASRSSDTATAQIQSQNVIGGLFESLDAVLEDQIIEIVAQETFLEMLKHRKDISDENLMWVFDGDQERATAFKTLPESEVLKLLGTAFKFRGKGLRSRAASKGRAQATVNMLSMIASNPMILQEVKDLFSFKLLFSKVFEALELDPEELELSERELDLIFARKIAEQQAMAQMQAQNALGDGQDPQGPGAPGNAQQGGPSEMPVGQQEGQAF